MNVAKIVGIPNQINGNTHVKLSLSHSIITVSPPYSVVLNIADAKHLLLIFNVKHSQYRQRTIDRTIQYTKF
jgi:hypothetical protein